MPSPEDQAPVHLQEVQGSCGEQIGHSSRSRVPARQALSQEVQVKDLGQFIQYDLNVADDCMELVDKFGWSNQMIRDMKAKGIRFQSVNKELMK